MRFHVQSERLALVWVGLVTGAIVACANGQTGMKLEEGPGAEVTVDGLHKVIHSKYRDAWVKPSADFASYTAVVLETVEITYQRKPKRSRYSTSDGNFALTDKQMAKMKSLFADIFSTEIEKSRYYRVTDTPGPAVLRLAPSIIDLRVNVPTDKYSGRERVYATSVGKMTLLLELHDSLSGEILARVADRREARLGGGFELQRANAISNTDAVRRVFRSWAAILRARLDEIHTLAPSRSLED